MNLGKLKEPFVLILIGPPLSGKTTWIKSNFDDNEYVLISRDQTLLDLHGDNNYNDAFSSVNQKEVDRILINKIKETVSNRENAIVDMTHMTKKRRSYNLSFFDGYYKVGVIFPILDDNEYQNRNNKRQAEENKFIPYHVLKNMISSYQTVSKEEGFNKIISI